MLVAPLIARGGYGEKLEAVLQLEQVLAADKNHP
jgi:hypothetical protein